MLNQDKLVVSDKGYTHQNIVTPRTESYNMTKLYGKIRARHETFNRRLRQRNVLARPFLHALNKQQSVFFCCTKYSTLYGLYI